MCMYVHVQCMYVCIGMLYMCLVENRIYVNTHAKYESIRKQIENICKIIIRN